MKASILGLLLVTSIAASIAASADHSRPTGCYTSPGYALQAYAEAEQQMLYWNSRYQAAPSGSAEERWADQRRRAEGQRALDVLAGWGALAGYPAVQLEGFAIDSNRKYQAASSGSFIESVYRSTLRTAWEAYATRAELEVSCNGSDYERTIQAANEASRKYQAATSGSAAETAYRRVLQTAWRVALEQLQQSLRFTNYDVSALENLALRFRSEYQAAPSGSARESFYRQATTVAFDAALSKLSASLAYYQTYDLVRLQDDYHRRYQAAPSGSSQESYYRRAKELVRQEIERRQGGGYPQPVPPLPPPGGNYVCTVTTAAGRSYQGTGPSRGSALADARSECIKYETSYACNAASAVCRH